MRNRHLGDYATVTDDDGKDGLIGLKNVQISEELFFALLKYHLVEIDDVLPQIKKGLEEKLEAMVRRELYTKYNRKQRSKIGMLSIIKRMTEGQGSIRSGVGNCSAFIL